jgi:hypothetical protein
MHDFGQLALCSMAALAITVQAASRFNPYHIDNQEDRPSFWKVRCDEIMALCANVTKGRAEIVATTPGGYPVYALFYGDFSEEAPKTNWSAGASSSTWKSYVGDKPDVQTILFCAGIHGAEAEGVAAAVNWIQMLETGQDFRGKRDEELLTLMSKYRVIILPCVNMDGRSISPDHLRKASFEDFRAASQGVWKDGTLIGWRGSKMFFPLPLEQVSYPGGYPNFDGVNIMHDATPGDIRSEEAKALAKLCARWRVDLLLNAHSCEFAPGMEPPTRLTYPKSLQRAIGLRRRINQAFVDAGLRPASAQEGAEASNTINLNNLAIMASGALPLTLECSVSYDKPQNPSRTYTFDELMEPVFIMLKVVMSDGLEHAFVDRGNL